MLATFTMSLIMTFFIHVKSLLLLLTWFIPLKETVTVFLFPALSVSLGRLVSVYVSTVFVYQ